MKANRKFRDGEEAVSAVIGVILMVAITVAIAATVYYYVTTMMPGAEEAGTPDIIMQKDDLNNVIRVLSADPNTKWSNVVVSAGSLPSGTYITAGEEITGIGTGAVTVTVTWTPTNTLLGTYEFTEG